MYNLSKPVFKFAFHCLRTQHHFRSHVFPSIVCAKYFFNITSSGSKSRKQRAKRTLFFPGRYQCREMAPWDLIRTLISAESCYALKRLPQATSLIRLHTIQCTYCKVYIVHNTSVESRIENELLRGLEDDTNGGNVNVLADQGNWAFSRSWNPRPMEMN